MIRVSVFYSNIPEKTFDHDYYVKTHMPLAGKLLQPIRWEVDKGLAGGAPDAPAPFVAACHFYFETLDAFQKGITEHGETLAADIPVYTNIEPTIQISEIVFSN